LFLITVTEDGTLALGNQFMGTEPTKDICEALKDLKQEVNSSNLPDKAQLSQSIDRLMEVKNCSGRRRS
jgi:hypothetical protein